MARSRNIKPGLWLNEDLADVSIPARYLFPALWCLADKDGRLEYRPKKIKIEVYPYDDIDIVSLVAELHGKQFISVYENEGSFYIQIDNFCRHQNPHPKEKSNKYPAPVNICNYDGNLKQFNFTASNVQTPFPSSSLIPSSLIPDALLPETREYPAWLNRKLWGEFRAWREEIGKGLSIIEETAALYQLQTFKEAGQDVDAVIRQSIISRWPGLFEVKGGKSPPATKQATEVVVRGKDGKEFKFHGANA